MWLTHGYPWFQLSHKAGTWVLEFATAPQLFLVVEVGGVGEAAVLAGPSFVESPGVGGSSY